MARALAIAFSSHSMIDPHLAPTTDDIAALVALAARGEVSAFEQDGEVRVPGVARCIVGTK